MIKNESTIVLLKEQRARMDKAARSTYKEIEKLCEQMDKLKEDLAALQTELDETIDSHNWYSDAVKEIDDLLKKEP